ncbi:serine/threonine-protein kinase [Nocardiopsis aegyptia]|uniref:serine/threonine-protein kinase n=1 Tax=Nocardiopsis aegyptia TaxID=220378 RepID=UPI00366A835E
MANTPGYRVDGELWRSGTGVVHLAEDVVLGRRVVVKSPHASMMRDRRFRERFVREFRMMAAVDHPHVVPVYAVGGSGEHMFAVMPYVRGGDLRSVLDAHGPLPLEAAVAVTGQIADALDHVHALGIVHRDVNPRNILLAGTDGAKALLTDFGLAVDTRGGAAAPLVPGAGTPGYSAPEQAAGGPVDHRADVYSLARVALSCLTGAVPDADGRFPDRDAARSLRSRRDLPARTAEAFARATSADPRERFGSCGAFAASWRSGHRRAVRPVGA